MVNKLVVAVRDSDMTKPPAWPLGDSHISEPPSVGEGFEVLEAVAEGDRAGRFGFWIGVPSVELGDDPRGPGKRFRWMRVLLERGLAFEFGQDCVEDFDFGGREGDLNRPALPEGGLFND